MGASEYGVLGPRLDRAATRQLMLQYCRGCKLPDGTPYFRHADAVAALSRRLTEHWYKRSGFVLPGDMLTVDNAWHAGMLHDLVVQHGCTWDELQECANLEVADLVAAVSWDNRLSYPRRVAAHAQQLAAAQPPAGLVKLADICCELEQAHGALSQGRAAVAQLGDRWLPPRIAYLGAIRGACGIRLQSAWDWCAKVVPILDAVIAAKRTPQLALREIPTPPWR